MVRETFPKVKEEDDDTNIHAYFQGEKARAYFVVLNRPGSFPAPGVYVERPADTALGKHIALLPIVVISSSKREAWTIHELNSEIIAGLHDPIDAKEFRQAIMQSPLVSSELMQETKSPYYALKVAQETGIFHGFDWKTQILPLTSFQKPLFKKFNMFGNALLWMLDKQALVPQFNTEVSGARLFGVAGTLPPIKNDCGASSAVPPTSVHRARSTSPVKACDPARSSTPTRGVTEHHAVTPTSTPTTPRKPRTPFPFSPSASVTSPGRARGGYTWPLGDDILVVEADDEGPGEDQIASPLVDHLRRVLRPAALSGGELSAAFNLGPHFDVWISARRISVAEQVAVLQAFIWSANVTEFSMNVGRKPVALAVDDAQYVPPPSMYLPYIRAQEFSRNLTCVRLGLHGLEVRRPDGHLGNLMARITGTDGLQRLQNKKRPTAKPYAASRRRAKKTGHPLSSLQRVQLKLERQKRAKALKQAIEDVRDDVWEASKKIHAEFQSHSADYFFRLIMQTTRIKTRQRKTSGWNAFLSQELLLRNVDGSSTRVSDGEVTREIAAKWHSMTKDEKDAATTDTIQELQQRKDDHAKGTHTVPIQAFNDARATLATLQREVEDLNTRTGVEVLLVAVRSDTSSYNQPFSFATSKRLLEFIKVITQNTLSQFALRMEGYCVSGMEGVAYNYQQSLINLKRDTALTINEKLQQASVRGTVGRMSYVNFDSITARFGIVVDNWPLKRFCAPGDICSRPELDTLLTSWTNGTTKFRSLSDTEWEAWKGRQAGMETPNPETASGDGGPVAASGSSAPPGGVIADGHAGGGDTAGGDTAGGDVGGGNTAGGDTAGGDAGGGDATSSSAGGGDATSSSATMAPPPAAAACATVGDSASASHRPSGDSLLASISTSSALGPRQRARAEVSFINVEVVTGADGQTITVAKRPRKARQAKKKTTSPAAPGPSATDSEPPHKKSKTKTKAKAKSAKENATPSR